MDIDALVAKAPTLNRAQKQALAAAVQHNIVLVSSGAGSGKTFLVSAITKLYEERGLRVVLAAPTGKAAKRIEQVVGREAMTIHRLLGFKGKAFTVGPENPIGDLTLAVAILDRITMHAIRLDIWPSPRADYNDVAGLLLLRGSWEPRSFLVSRDLPGAALADMY